MTQGFNGDGIIELLLGWFRYLANSLMSMITGSGGNGLLRTLSVSWKSLLVFLIIAGCALNVVIYVIRWRPHWWWFAKKRMLVDDSIFESGKKRKKTAEPKPAAPSTIVPRRTPSAKSRQLFDTGSSDVFKVKKHSNK